MKPGLFIYDIEVLRGPDEVDGGWNNPEAMGFGCAVVYGYEYDQYYFYGPDEKDWLVILLANAHVVSFNGIKFDNRVIFGNDYNSAVCDRKWSDIDLLLKVVRGKFNVDTVADAETKFGMSEVHDGSIGLDGLAKGTLGMGKTGHGSKAPDMIREGKWDGVYAYCLHDVRLTRKLYEFAKQYGYLIDRNGTKIPVEV